MGLECARRLGVKGAAVALCDLDESLASEAAADLRREGVKAIACPGDVTVQGSVAEVVERTTAENGAPNVLVNAAGILRSTRISDITLDEWNMVVDVSLKGAFLCSQACLPAMVEGGWGRIVNFSSTAGKNVSTLGGVHYTAAKAGVLGLTRATAKEVAHVGVTVNAVCPGLIETGMVREMCDEATLARYASSFPVGRLGQPSEVAAMVEFLCNDEAAYITGASFDINGGDLMI